MNSDSEEYLIQYFENLLLEQAKKFDNNNGCRQILYMFCLTEQKIDFKTLIADYFGQKTKCCLFKKAQKYIIVKIITEQGIIYFKQFFSKIFVQIILVAQQNQLSILELILMTTQQNQIIVFKRVILQILEIGWCIYQVERQKKKRVMSQNLSLSKQSLSFIKLFKVICSMLNHKGGRILVGISYDRDMQSNVVAGCYCTQKTKERIIETITEKCKEFIDLVEVRVHDCGIIIENQCQIVSNLKIFEIIVKESEQLITLNPGRYYVRDQGNSNRLKLSQLYQMLKSNRLKEDEFEQCLEWQDQFNEQQLMKKTKNSSNK